MKLERRILMYETLLYSKIFELKRKFVSYLLSIQYINFTVYAIRRISYYNKCLLKDLKLQLQIIKLSKHLHKGEDVPGNLFINPNVLKEEQQLRQKIISSFEDGSIYNE